MPTIAYMRAHGTTDFPHHFAFFGYLEKLGILDKYDFLLESVMDPAYCARLVRRFPQLKILEDQSRPRRWMREVAERVGRGYRPFAYLDTFDAVCEAPGGRINEFYTKNDVFRFYPRVKRRAILFHSIEQGALKQPSVRESVAGADLVIARTSRSAENARGAGAKWVVDSADIAFLEHPKRYIYKPGIATAFRLPNAGVTEEYLDRLREIVANLEKTDTQVDFVRVEEPFGQEMIREGLGTYLRPNTGVYSDDTMYLPFLAKRDAIITSRLHTTLLSLMYGNRKILQFHIEGGTNKSVEIFNDMGIHSVPVHQRDEVTWKTVEEFLAAEPNLPEEEAAAALDLAKSKTIKGMDAFLEWLDTIK
ncbi:polysaccharide pyruvyl transferase family protein [Aquisphaera insulae]|uniref:polysaccharide pyruvyl transferase family protein n=1 Tax=Aquisphaera insulae TaxID=2712864 RepID=UPI0013E9FA5A|nr:polysaccharide pyruvyl transferase family protein [Aquisphaera insulae]